METDKITTEQFIAAIEKNGYPQIRNSLFMVDGNKIHACALGQAMLNLGIVSESAVRRAATRGTNPSIYYARLRKRMNLKPGGWSDMDIITKTYHKNDVNKLSVKVIAEQLRKEYNV